jgi:uncharacterized Zn finger protein
MDTDDHGWRTQAEQARHDVLRGRQPTAMRQCPHCGKVKRNSTVRQARRHRAKCKKKLAQ